MTHHGSSVTTWIERLRANDPEAAAPLWARYYSQLVRIAHDHLAQRLRGLGEEEDVALEAFASFCQGIRQGRFPSIATRDDLWRLLLTITIRKARDHARREDAERRGGGRNVRETDLLQLADVDLDAFVGAEPDPGFAVEVADQLAFLLKLLPGDDLREVARSCLEEQSLTEIARQRGCSTRTIQRKWSLIVRIWRDHIS